MSEQHPRDEFDDVPDDGPVGVHRKPRSPWQSVLPFLIVLIVVPLLAWGVTAIVKGKPSNEAAPPAQSQGEVEVEQSAPAPVPPAEEEGPTGLPEDLSDEGADPEPGGEPAVEPAPVDFAASVAVLNASGINGLAGSVTTVLQDAGFANAWAGNSSDAVTTSNTVYYRDASLRSTAEAVGNAIGVATLVENAEAVGDGPITVLLKAQP